MFLFYIIRAVYINDKTRRYMAKNSSTIKINNCARKRNILLKLGVSVDANMLGLDENMLNQLRKMFTYIVTQLKFLTQSQQFVLDMQYLAMKFCG